MMRMQLLYLINSTLKLTKAFEKNNPASLLILPRYLIHEQNTYQQIIFFGKITIMSFKLVLDVWQQTFEPLLGLVVHL